MKKLALQSSSEIKKEARKEITNVVRNPLYIFRTLNKYAAGKDTIAKEVEGYSREYVKELCDRLQEAFNQGGFWWGSVIARKGYIVTSVRKVAFAEGDEDNSDVNGLYTAKGGELLTEVINGDLYSLRAAASWNIGNVIASAGLALKFAEARAKEAGSLYTWQQEQEAARAKQKEARKQEARKARKEAQKQKEQQKEQEQKEATAARKQAQAIQDLKKQYESKQITKAEYTKQLLALVA